MNPIVQRVIEGVIAFSVGNVVNNAIRATTPTSAGIITKVGAFIGALAIGSAVSDHVSDHTIAKIHEALNEDQNPSEKTD